MSLVKMGASPHVNGNDTAPPDPIRTDRLLLACLTPELLRLLENDQLEAASRITGLRFTDSWHESKDVLALRAGELEREPTFLAWSLRAIARIDDGRVVGHIGCHAKPGASSSDHLKPAGVEFGYTVFPPYRRQGIATDALRGMMAWAARNGATHFVLSIAPDNAPSQNLAAKLGFEKVGQQIDEIDGPEDVLARRP